MSLTVKIFLWILLIACMVILAKNILFKNNRGYNTTALKKEFTLKNIKSRWARANLEPMKTIKLFYYSRKLNAEYKLGNLAGNIAGFIPLGILLPLLISWLRRGWQTFFAVFLISLGFELAQLCFGLGIFDVDDLILNTIGGIIGYIVYWIGRTIFRSSKTNVEYKA